MSTITLVIGYFPRLIDSALKLRIAHHDAVFIIIMKYLKVRLKIIPQL